jgi:hypothetical protein
MKTIFILIASILLLSSGYAETEDSIFVIISGDTVHIWNTGAYENCGCLFRMDVMVSNDTIHVTEVDTTSNWAFCMCYFDMCASVTGLQNGTYLVEVFRYMPLAGPDTTFVGSTSFTYGGSGLAFNSHTFQSECYNITEAREGENYPMEYSLSQNYPNPFNPVTIIKYSIPKLSFVTLKVFNVLGREVATLVDEEKPAGNYEVEFFAKGGPTSNGDAYNLTSGIYFYTIKAGEFIQTKKMVLLR